MDVFGTTAPALPPAPPEAPPAPPGPPAAPSAPSLAPPAPPEAPAEPVFGKVDTDAWDSNWGSDWSETADVFEAEDPAHVPETIQEEVEWEAGAAPVPVVMSEMPLPSEAALKRMKKGELVDLATGRGVDGSGTKSDIIARLLG